MFFEMWGIWVSKYAAFNVLYAEGPLPVYIDKNLEPKITFVGACCRQGKFIFLKSMLNSASFNTHTVYPHCEEKKLFDLLYSA
jgi:hypothetical protein